VAKVIFTSEGLEVDVEPGITLQEIATEVDCDMTFGCRSGTCGTCRVKVLEGHQNISPMQLEEQEFLRGFGAQKDERLGCQMKIVGDCALQYVGLDDLT
jgi:ferredoxin